MPIRGAAEIIKKEAMSWDQVECGPHRFGGIEYRVGTREIGHMHGDALMDIPFPKRVRDQIVAAGEAQPHHVLPETGWVSFYIREEADIERAIRLLKRSYEIAVEQKTRRGGSQSPNSP
jgi:luciferase-like monooxygenase